MSHPEISGWTWMAQDPETEALFDRLKDVVSGDAALRQLRRRYEALRLEHENLLDRLGELEMRVASGQPPPAPAPRPPEPGTAASETIAEALSAPLLRLRDDYLAAAGRLQAIVEGLDTLAAASFKGQRSSGAHPPRPEPVRYRPTEPAPELASSHIEVDVKGSDFGSLLDFQEHLSSLPGVKRVSIKAIDNERASLLVELAE